MLYNRNVISLLRTIFSHVSAFAQFCVQHCSSVPFEERLNDMSWYNNIVRDELLLWSSGLDFGSPCGS